MTDFATLPADLPAPVDDGACNHLAGMSVPGIGLHSTASRILELAGLPGRTAVYCYPMTGAPGVALPDNWDLIPGARGCTPQACAFRDHHQELAELGAQVLGLSAQTTDYQREMADGYTCRSRC
jgi:peroxiredoxin